jgi:hypothetical protein
MEQFQLAACLELYQVLISLPNIHEGKIGIIKNKHAHSQCFLLYGWIPTLHSKFSNVHHLQILPRDGNGIFHIGCPSYNWIISTKINWVDRNI